MLLNVHLWQLCPAGANGTDLSIHPDFTGTVKIIDTNSPILSFDPNGRIQTCNASDACTVGNKRDLRQCRVGVHCYGCQGVPYGCQELRSYNCRAPSAFVAAGPTELAVNVSDPRCDRWQLNRYGAVADSSNRWCPELVWAATVAVRAVCPGFRRLQRACQRVMDSSGWQTHQHSIVGPVLTNDRSPTFTLGANKAIAPTTSAWTVARRRQEAATTGSLTRSG